MIQPQSQSEPGWQWEAKDMQGKRVAGWTLFNDNTQTPELLLAHLRSSFHALNYLEFKCERQNGPPDSRQRQVPPKWWKFGTDRMKAEIEAGLRPHSDYLLPPIEIATPHQAARLARTMGLPLSQRLNPITRH